MIEEGVLPVTSFQWDVLLIQQICTTVTSEVVLSLSVGIYCDLLQEKVIFSLAYVD
jgi:hypothetical protein